MSAMLLDGRALAATLNEETRGRFAAITAARGAAPKLALVMVGDDAASARYLRTIARLCSNLGAEAVQFPLAADVGENVLQAWLRELSDDRSVDGILLQLPLPAGYSLDTALACLAPEKDVDGVHPFNAGMLALGRPTLVPNTPAGGMELLRRNGIELRGRRALVIGRSPIVGRPMAQLLLAADATVTIAHSRTADLAGEVRRAEIIAAAIGRPGLISADMISPGAVIVDFGTNVLPDGSLVGDVDPAAAATAAAMTPVPGGTGPVTNAMLMRNLAQAAEQRR
jgi:methylenetetrahydrofolate dehydrogenase (NADP+) / methenyltetrahydrofolate cyclohydrolase